MHPLIVVNQSHEDIRFDPVAAHVLMPRAVCYCWGSE